MNKLTDTTCPNCGGDCELDLKWMENRYSDPLKTSEENRMWKCTKCGARYTNSILFKESNE